MLISALLIATLGFCVLAPLLPGFDPFGQDLDHGMARPFQSWAHPLGTDILGRDMVDRLALAGRTSSLIAILALSLNVATGVLLGLVAGYFKGPIEAVIMGLADLQISIPVMMLLVMVVAVIGSSAVTLTLVLGLSYWIGYGRVARVIAVSLRDREFVLSAQTQGASAWWTIRKHLLPQVIPQVAIMASFDLGVLVILEAGLSYLGLGVRPPMPSWGGMIAEGQDFMQIDPWLCVFPGAAISILVGGVQLLSQRVSGETGVDR
jgi:peptide/nickel transport system permease protein